MFGYTKLTVSDTERVLLLKDKQPEQILTAGQYQFFDARGRLSFERFNISGGAFEFPDLELVLKQRKAVFAEHIITCRAGNDELVLVYLDEQLVDLITPGKFQAYWNDRGNWDFEHIDIVDGEVVDEAIKTALTNIDSVPVKVRDRLQRMTMNISVSDVERIFVILEKQLHGVLDRGNYFLWNRRKQLSVVQTQFGDTALGVSTLELWLNEYPDLLSAWLTTVQTEKQQVLLAYLDGRLVDVIAPETRASFWTARGKWHFERIECTGNMPVARQLVRELCLNDNAQIRQKADKLMLHFEVDNNTTALVFDSGELLITLDAGYYGFWKDGNQLKVKLIDGRQHNLDVSGQEILTRDRVSLRLNLSAQYKVEDAVKAVTGHADFKDYIYRSLQLALREAVGTRTLDELLMEKDALNTIVFSAAQEAVAECGVNLMQVGVRDIILPGEMKTILNQVVEAQKTAEANIIKRREETAATRSLHNTAKVMEGNATLLRLKELEVLERISDRIDSMTVYGGLDGVMRELVSLPGTSK